MDENNAMLIAACGEARRIAPNLCEVDPETGENCAWYHGFWPSLHALNVTTRPDHHRAFYADNLSALARDGYRRVLISGSADFNMLQQVYAAFDTWLAPDNFAADGAQKTALQARRDG